MSVQCWVSGTVKMRTPWQSSTQERLELAALYASVAEALDLEAAISSLVMHICSTHRSENAMGYFIETTLIGRTDFSED